MTGGIFLGTAFVPLPLPLPLTLMWAFLGSGYWSPMSWAGLDSGSLLNLHEFISSSSTDILIFLYFIFQYSL